MVDPLRRKEWLVSGSAVASGALAKHVAGDPDVQTLAQVANDTVVLTMPSDRARRLASEMPGLIIEPNDPPLIHHESTEP